MIVYHTTKVLISSLKKADYVLFQHANVLVSHWLIYINTNTVLEELWMGGASSTCTHGSKVDMERDIVQA